MVHSNNGNRWYARRNGIVRGPFTDENIARNILLGRIRLEDELSQDRVRWRPVGDYPDLFPEELLQLSSWEDYQTLVVTRMKVDERLEERRGRQGKCQQSPSEERRKSPDRRRLDGDAEFFKYHLMDYLPYIRRGPDHKPRQPLRTFFLALLLVTLVFAYFGISAR
jgi:hypothetical protein